VDVGGDFVDLMNSKDTIEDTLAKSHTLVLYAEGPSVDLTTELLT
jgi:hypothetical protein